MRRLTFQVFFAVTFLALALEGGKIAVVACLNSTTYVMRPKYNFGKSIILQQLLKLTPLSKVLYKHIRVDKSLAKQLVSMPITQIYLQAVDIRRKSKLGQKKMI